MQKSLETQIQINASPAQVWSVFAGGPDWSQWNPFILEVKGRIEPGRQISATLKLGKGAPMLFRPWVLVVRPDQELRWVGRILGPWIFSGEHYFILEAKDGGTLLTHGEKFRGVFTFLLNMENVQKGFEAFNQGLKKKAEV
jgi:hypothetical protein